MKLAVTMGRRKLHNSSSALISLWAVSDLRRHEFSVSMQNEFYSRRWEVDRLTYQNNP